MITSQSNTSILPPLRVLSQTTSTNDDLAHWWKEEPALPPYCGVLTRHQSDGRGRLGRQWVAPADTAMLLSVLVAAPISAPISWVPLSAGVALRNLVREEISPSQQVALKWPNDVLLDGKKVAGILSEFLGERDGLVWLSVGIGLNLTQTSDQLPAIPATSLRLSGSTRWQDRDSHQEIHSLAEKTRQLLHAQWGDCGENLTDPTELRRQYLDHFATLGRPVSVTLPDGEVINGMAHAVDQDGGLIVIATNGQQRQITAGDVQLTSNLSPFPQDPSHTLKESR